MKKLFILLLMSTAMYAQWPGNSGNSNGNHGDDDNGQGNPHGNGNGGNGNHHGWQDDDTPTAPIDQYLVYSLIFAVGIAGYKILRRKTNI